MFPDGLWNCALTPDPNDSDATGVPSERGFVNSWSPVQSAVTPTLVTPNEV